MREVPIDAYTAGKCVHGKVSVILGPRISSQGDQAKRIRSFLAAAYVVAGRWAEELAPARTGMILTATAGPRAHPFVIIQCPKLTLDAAWAACRDQGPFNREGTQSGSAAFTQSMKHV